MRQVSRTYWSENFVVLTFLLQFFLAVTGKPGKGRLNPTDKYETL